MRVLLIGPMFPPVSGSVQLFRRLIYELPEDLLHFEVIDTSKYRSRKYWLLGSIIAAFYTLFLMLRALPRVNIITFHASLPALLSFGPVIVIFGKFFRKPVMTRLFGGQFEVSYECLPRVYKWFLRRTLFRAQMNVVESHHLMEMFKNYGARDVRWLPNYTKLYPLAQVRSTLTDRCTKFVYLGRITQKKGVGIILEAARLLSAGSSVDFFGSLDLPFDAESIPELSDGRACYRGILDQEGVETTLFSYDALLLPTMWEGEGYPGVILQAAKR